MNRLSSAGQGQKCFFRPSPALHNFQMSEMVNHCNAVDHLVSGRRKVR